MESTPGFKYAMEIQNQTSAKEVFQKMLAQLVTLTLGEVLGSSFELGKHFLKANQSHRLPVQKSSNAMAEYESEEEVLMSRGREFSVDCGDVACDDAEELHEWLYQAMLEKEYEGQWTQEREVKVARPNEYRAMVTARLNGKVHDREYTTGLSTNFTQSS